MSRWIRTFAALSLLLIVQLGWTSPVRAQVPLSRLAGLQGRIVVIERYDGTWLLVRILAVGATQLTVELEDGLRGTVRVSTISKVRTHRLEQPRGPYPRPRPDKTSNKRTSSSPSLPHKFRVEWIAAQGGFGVSADFDYYSSASFSWMVELRLFTLHWRHFYWEILRVGGGMPTHVYWGTAFGYPFHLDDHERHELRLGVHISLRYGFLPMSSGVQLYYMYRPKKRFSITVGLMQTSYPFSVIASVGVSM